VRITKGRLAVAELAGAALLAWVPMSGAASAAPGSTAAVPAAAGESGTLNCSQLESLWEEAGGSPSAAFTAAEVAMAESSGREYATNSNANGTTDRGYWQINSTWGGESTFSPLGNAEAAKTISKDGTDWSPWVTVQRGMQNGQCPPQ
jgi:Lysozyme like domain